MSLSRVICVTHYTGFPFGSASSTELLCWYGTVRLIGFAPVYLQELCRPVSTLVGRQALRSSSGGKTLSSPCKHLDYAASCILSCCSFYLEFTSLPDSVVTKELHAFALQAA